MKGYTTIPVLYMRGGTSKGAYIGSCDLPSDPRVRDQLIMNLYGTPDKRQIDGIGGADPLTSKVAIVGPSVHEGADVDYTFGYVGIEKAEVDYEGNCGNMSAGVGVYAIIRGLVEAVAPITIVRIYNTNTNKIIEAHVPVEAGAPVIDGDFAIDGVPGTGARITLFFLEAGGSKTGRLLPTGHVKDTLTLTDGQQIEVSLVDAANPAVFVKASDIGYKGTELPSEADADGGALLAVLEDIRTSAAVMMGLADSKATASSAVPKVCMVAPPTSYVTSDGRHIEAKQVDVVGRTKALAVMHKAYAVTGGICTATAALIPGTVVNEVVSERAKATKQVILAHPSGQLQFEVVLTKKEQGWHLAKAGVARTARPILDGTAYVRRVE